MSSGNLSATLPVRPASSQADDAEEVRALAARYFDQEYYLYTNGDLRAAKAANARFDLFDHFILHGAEEGRSPSIEFDIGYVQHRLSRIEGIDIPATDIFLHFARLPAERRFVPNRWFSPWAFRGLYGERYPEIAGADDYRIFEIYLDRRAYAALSPCGVFSEEHYRLRHRDVAIEIGQGKCRAGLIDFLLHGGHKSRRNLPGTVNVSNPSSQPWHIAEMSWLLSGQIGLERIVWWFDEGFYLSVYPDVHDLVRRMKIKSGMEHYLVSGYAERRLPSPWMLRHLPEAAIADVWRFVALLAPTPENLAAKLSMSEAWAVLRYLKEQEFAAGHRKVTEALWPFVKPPEVGGYFDAHLYMAVNVDVARSVGYDAEAARGHWEHFGRRENRMAPGTNMFADRGILFEDVVNWRSGVNFFGPLSAASGLGNAARGYVTALRAAGIEVDTYDVSSILDPKLPGDIFCADSLAYSINLVFLNADQVQQFAVRYGTEIFAHRANVGAWVWELMSPRPEWRGGLSAFDLIITPSRFCSDSFAVTTDCPIRTIPYVVDAKALYAARDASTGNHWTRLIEAEKRAGRKIILFIMDASSYRMRKGVDVYCKLAERLSREHPGKFLFVLKSHSRDVSATAASAAQSFGEAVFLVEGVFSFPDLCLLKSMADLYISPHRSEGFGLNIIESILLGVPALCSDFAGATDLLADNEDLCVPVTLAEIGREMGPYRAEAIWCEPDIEAFETAILRHIEGNGPDQRFEELRLRLETELSAAAVGAQLRRELQALCALDAETSPNRLEAFRAIGTARHDECFRLGYVKEEVRRSRDAPGLDRLSEITMTALNPFFSIVTVIGDASPDWLAAIYDDLLHQSYPAWEWCICDVGAMSPETRAALVELRRGDARLKVKLGSGLASAAAATNAAVAIAQGRYVLIVQQDDRLAPEMLATYCERLQRPDAAGITYCDEDRRQSAGAGVETSHRPDWSPEHLLSSMYVGRSLCIRKSLFLEMKGFREGFDGAADHDFMLRATAAGAVVQHVDRILYHKAAGAADAAGATDGGCRAIGDYLGRIGITATVEPGLIAGTYRPRPRLTGSRVTLNILTACTLSPDRRMIQTDRRQSRRRQGDMPNGDGRRANGRQINGAGSPPTQRTYVEQFVRSILRYAPALEFEIRVIVDAHAEAVAAPLARLDPRVSIVPFQKSGPHFNFAEKANFALATAGSDRLVLLNDDMEAMDGEWLPALLEILELPGTGIVGGSLINRNETLQHAGIALGIFGATAHLFEGAQQDDVCYNGYNKVIRNYSAVTGAMMALRPSTFERVGGFDVNFPIDYNDVDFCLRVGEVGLRTVFTPFARLRHFESRSAQRLVADSLDRQVFCRRWSHVIEHDPFYNRNLSRQAVMCELA